MLECEVIGCEMGLVVGREREGYFNTRAEVIHAQLTKYPNNPQISEKETELTLHNLSYKRT